MRSRLLLKNVLMPGLMAIVSIYGATAQNSSYDSNTLSIGGTNSCAFGFEALKVNTGDRNIAFGRQTLTSNTSGFFNIAIGDNALFSNTGAGCNIAIGYGSLYLNSSGNRNTALGHSSLFFNTSGEFNTATGYNVLTQNTTGSRNTAMGMDVLTSNTTGFGNSGFGWQALVQNNTGLENTAVGYRALRDNVEGSFNTAIGDSAGKVSVGSGNVYIGRKAGATETGSNKFYLANDADNALIYGDFFTKQVLLGKPDATGYVFKGNRTLNVLGGILTDSIRVALSGSWSDYVFADDYKLKTPEELASFIKTNNHLPNVPGAKEVAANGVNLVEMNAKLLEKIEELTLYMLQQQKQINELRDLVKKDK